MPFIEVDLGSWRPQLGVEIAVIVLGIIDLLEGVHPCLGLSIVEAVIWLEYASFLPFIHPFPTFC